MEMKPTSTEIEAVFTPLTCYALFKEALQNTATDLSRSSGVLIEVPGSRIIKREIMTLNSVFSLY